MTATTPLTDPTHVSNKSQRRRTAANVSADSPASKRTPRTTRSSNRSTGSEANGVESANAPESPVKRKDIEAGPPQEVPPPLPGAVTPKKARQRKEVKREIGEDTQEQVPQVKGTLTSSKRIRRVEEDQGPADLQVDGDTPKTAKRKRIVKVEKVEVEVDEQSPKRTKHTKATETAINQTAGDEAPPKKAKRKTKVKEEDEEVQEGEVGQDKIKRKRRTKEEKELEAMPLAVRTDGLRMFIGAHVSGAKGWFLSMYISSVELRLVFVSRSSQFSHKLRAHWVNNLQVSQIEMMTDTANLSAEMPLLCSLSHRRSGRTLLCKTIIETSSEHCVVSISTTQPSIKPFSIPKSDPAILIHQST